MPTLVFGPAEMLFLAAAAAAPIIIHLIVRERPKRIPFPAIRFLQARVSRRLRKLRLKHLLLLALRVLAIVALAFAMAEPALKGGCVRAAGGGNVVVVIDDSLSMMAVSEGDSGFARACRKAERFIRELPFSTRLAVVTTSSPGVVFSSNKEEALAKLKALKCAAGAHRAWPAVADAVSVLARQKEGARLVVLFSDMTVNAWRGAESGASGLAETVKIALVPVRSEGAANFYFSSARLREDSLDPGAEAVIEYVVATPEKGGTFKRVEFYVDGRMRGRSSARKGRFALKVARDRPFVQGELKLVCEDELRADNTWRFTIAATRSSRVLLLRGEDEESSRALPAALYASTGKEPRVVSPAKLELMHLAPSDVVVAEGLEVLSEKLLRKMLDFVVAGGGLMVFPSASMRGETRLNVDWRLLLPGFVFKKAPAEEPLRLDVVDENHPVARAFAEASFTDRNIRAPRFKAFVKLATIDEFSYTKILTYSNGAPALVAKTQGAGRVLFFAGALDRSWSDLAAHPSFVVLVSEAVKFLSGKSDERFNFKFGEFVPVRLPRSRSRGLLLRVPGTSRDLAVEKPPRTLAARKSGNYYFYYADDGAKALAFSVNVGPEESLLRELGREELLRMLGGAEIVERPTADLLKGAAGETQLPIHGAALVFILVLLSAEEIVANRFYKKVAEGE